MDAYLVSTTVLSCVRSPEKPAQCGLFRACGVRRRVRRAARAGPLECRAHEPAQPQFPRLALRLCPGGHAPAREHAAVGITADERRRLHAAVHLAGHPVAARRGRQGQRRCAPVALRAVWRPSGQPAVVSLHPTAAARCCARAAALRRGAEPQPAVPGGAARQGPTGHFLIQPLSALRARA